MIKVAGIKFKTAGKIYDFKSCAFVLAEGDPVIVETEQGLGFGRIAVPPYEIENTEKKLKQIVRIATKEDFLKREEIKILEKKAQDFCSKCINDLGLMMNLFSVESTFDRNKLTFFYTADGRIDFRELIKLLVKKFSIRIEMRQVGIRNLSKHYGGVGKCGRELCCSSFMHTFEPVSIKMAKNQTTKNQIKEKKDMLKNEKSIFYNPDILCKCSTSFGSCLYIHCSRCGHPV